MTYIAKPTVNPSSPVRASQFYTVGGGSQISPIVTASTSPNIGTNAQSNNAVWNVVGTDYQPGTITYISSIGAGGSALGSTTVLLTGLPSQITFNPTDSVRLFCSISSTPLISALLLLGETAITPIARRGATNYFGPILQGGINYDSYAVQISMVAYSPGSVAAGQYVNFFVTAMLLQLPGE